MALDQADLLDLVRDKEGRIEGYVPSAIEGFALLEAELKQKLRYDLAEAKRLAQASGLAGQKIVLTSRLQSSYFLTGSQLFQQRFKEIGLDLALEYFADTTAFNRAQAGGEFQMLFVPEAFNGDVDNWVYGIWHSKSPTNFAKVNDPKVDKFAEDQRAELDAAKRKQIVLDFQRYMLDQAYWIPIPSQVYRNAYQNYVKNFSRHWSFGMPGLEEAWLDK
jgi:peptide/nickel transport system substrate-binding protein